MAVLLRLAVWGLAIDTALIAGYVAWSWFNKKPLELAVLFAAGGACIGLATFLTNLRRARSQDVLGAVTDLLEKSFATLVDPNTSNPVQDRKAWLTAARLLKTAQTLSESLVETSHTKIYVETREYWRGKFYDLIYPRSPHGLPSAFYADEPSHMVVTINQQRSPPSEKSLAYLYRFIQWPEGLPDPIADEPMFTAEEIHRMQTFGPRGLGELMSNVRALQAPGNRDS